MKNIKTIYLLLIVGITGLWLIAADFSTYTASILSVRGFMVDYTGFLSIAVMSVAMILAVRPKIIEPMLNGLDKGYRLHKWLGITALVTSVTHWLSAMGPKWATALGLLELGARNGHGQGKGQGLGQGLGRGGQDLDALQSWLRSQRGLAEMIGEWAFYIAVFLIVMALIKRIAYNRSFNFHRVFPVVYLGLVFHALILVKTSYWLQPIGIVTAILLVGGSISALLSLFGAIGKQNRHTATVREVIHFDSQEQVKIEVELDGKWPGHRAGQFAFVRFSDTKEAHPFTLSSAWQDDNRASFIIKALGDHTHTLVHSLVKGETLSVEGPYGEFDFNSHAPQQVWIAGGIGITPFLARMKYLAVAKKFTQPITLFYCMKSMDANFIDHINRIAREANVNVIYYVEDRDGQLSIDCIKKAVPNWSQADYWFCGPTQFGQSMKSSLVDSGVKAQAFHQELFEMR